MRQLISRGEAVTVLSGAGISTDSGIPDFRGPNGVWTRDPEAERLSTLQYYLDDPGVRVKAWRRRIEHDDRAPEPNAGHLALVALEAAGIVRTIVTQNIDGLHQRAGSRRVIEIHGSLAEAVCLSCGRRTPIAEALDRVRAGDPDPPCHACGGIQKSSVISFGQALDEDVVRDAELAARSCDVLLAVGTSLSVYPAAGLCDVARSAGARLVIVNAEPTAYDEIADTVVREPIGDVLPGLAKEFA